MEKGNVKYWRWILTLLFGLLVALASAQTFQRSLPFLAKPSVASSYSPRNVDGLKWWWVYSDLSDGSVDSWADRVQGGTFVNSGTRRPTKGATGVAFVSANSQNLTNDTGFYSGDPFAVNKSTHFFVIYLATTNAYQDFLNLSPASTATVVGITSGSAFFVYVNPTISSDGPLPINTWMDVAVSCDGAATSTIFYMNGTPVKTNSASVMGAPIWKCMGGRGTEYLNGTIKEVLIYSNVVSSVNVSNLHYYATNLYGYSP